MPWITKVVHANSTPPGTESLPITIPNNAKVTRMEVVQQADLGIVDFRLYYQEVNSADEQATDWAVGSTEGERPGKFVNVGAGVVAAGVHAHQSESAAVVDLKFDLRKLDGTPSDPAETPWAIGVNGTEYKLQAPANSNDPDGNLRAYHIVGMLAYSEAGQGVTDIGFNYQMIPLGDAGQQLVNLATPQSPGAGQ